MERKILKSWDKKSDIFVLKFLLEVRGVGAYEGIKIIKHGMLNVSLYVYTLASFILSCGSAIKASH